MLEKVNYFLEKLEANKTYWSMSRRNPQRMIIQHLEIYPPLLLTSLLTVAKWRRVKRNKELQTSVCIRSLRRLEEIAHPFTQSQYMYVIHALPPFRRAHSPDPIPETKSPHGSTSGRLEESILLDISISASTRALKASSPDACKIRTAIYFFQKSHRVLFVFKRQRVAHEYERLIPGPSFPHEGTSSSTSMMAAHRGHQLQLASDASTRPNSTSSSPIGANIRRRVEQREQVPSQRLRPDMARQRRRRTVRLNGFVGCS